MATAQITAVMLDGTKHEATGAYMALADRVAFERKYESSIIEMSRQARHLGEDGMPLDESDLSGLREERAAFFAWRTLERGGCPVGEFDAWLDAVDEITIDRMEGEADPTAAAPPSGT